MTKTIFIFIISLLLLTPLILNAGEISSSYQLIICIPFILFIGIPHGAIDNVLYIRNKEMKNAHFISVYLMLIIANVLLWLIFPSAAYVLFLTLSAYHFGQSQFSHYLKKEYIIHKLVYFFWGVSILSALIYFNITEIDEIMIQEEVFAVFRPLNQENLMLFLFIFSSIGTLLLLIFLTIKKSFNIEELLMETLVLLLIFICFYLMPLLIGFTFYFVILHSLKVLREEYKFLNTKKEVNSVFQFILLVAPLTILSIIGITLIYCSIYLDLLDIDYGYCLLIFISSITFPHVFVMNKFYSIIQKAK